MKQVLLIDAPPLFREFLKEKLTAEKISVDVADGRRDAFMKMVTQLPALIILDTAMSLKEVLRFLEKKHSDPNAKRIPVIMTGPIIDRELVTFLIQHNVVKYFNKPIKFDVFFEAVGKLLRVNFSIDTTPCILEIHLNNDIIFVEIAQGLNREKLQMLKYKISEIIDENKLSNPKLVLMMTDLSLSFVDGANLELLFDNIIADPRVNSRHVKVLTLDPFTKELILGHTQYQGIEVAANLSSILNSLVDTPETNDIADLISEKILSSTDDVSQGTVQMRFYSETGDMNSHKTDEKPMKFAVIDNDPKTRAFLQTLFRSLNAETDLFDSGTPFLAATNKTVYDLVILDIFIPGVPGFDILKSMRAKHYTAPVIVYSVGTQREMVIQALNLGARSYLIKPLKPEVILQKVIEVLHSKV